MRPSRGAPSLFLCLRFFPRCDWVLCDSGASLGCMCEAANVGDERNLQCIQRQGRTLAIIMAGSQQMVCCAPLITLALETHF